MKEAWPKVGTERTLTDEVYEIIRDRLMGSFWTPGTFIREKDVGEAMGVSRTPVREALGRLASEGMVERIPRRGFRVPARSMEELLDLYPVLQALEVLAGKLAFPRMGELALQAMEKANSAFAEALERNETVTSVELNDQFHEVVSDNCGNRVLQELLDDLRGQIRRLEFVDFAAVLGEMNGETRRKWVRQHQRIVDAARAGDFDEACQTLHENRSIAYLTDATALRKVASGDGGPP
ncbi:MAG: GntR family transcriptional regulator [Gemmatimonadota bacterium]|jgi:DNA-binding GntR family transcriptional regulator